MQVIGKKRNVLLIVCANARLVTEGFCVSVCYCIFVYTCEICPERNAKMQLIYFRGRYWTLPNIVYCKIGLYKLL